MLQNEPFHTTTRSVCLNVWIQFYVSKEGARRIYMQDFNMNVTLLEIIMAGLVFWGDTKRSCGEDALSLTNSSPWGGQNIHLLFFITWKQGLFEEISSLIHWICQLNSVACALLWWNDFALNFLHDKNIWGSLVHLVKKCSSAIRSRSAGVLQHPLSPSPAGRVGSCTSLACRHSLCTHYHHVLLLSCHSQTTM